MSLESDTVNDAISKALFTPEERFEFSGIQILDLGPSSSSGTCTITQTFSKLDTEHAMIHYMPHHDASSRVVYLYVFIMDSSDQVVSTNVYSSTGIIGIPEFLGAALSVYDTSSDSTRGGTIDTANVMLTPSDIATSVASKSLDHQKVSITENTMRSFSRSSQYCRLMSEMRFNRSYKPTHFSSGTYNPGIGHTLVTADLKRANQYGSTTLDNLYSPTLDSGATACTQLLSLDFTGDGHTGSTQNYALASTMPNLHAVRTISLTMSGVCGQHGTVGDKITIQLFWVVRSYPEVTSTDGGLVGVYPTGDPFGDAADYTRRSGYAEAFSQEFAVGGNVPEKPFTIPLHLDVTGLLPFIGRAELWGYAVEQGTTSGVAIGSNLVSIDDLVVQGEFTSSTFSGQSPSIMSIVTGSASSISVNAVARYGSILEHSDRLLGAQVGSSKYSGNIEDQLRKRDSVFQEFAS